MKALRILGIVFLVLLAVFGVSLYTMSHGVQGIDASHHNTIKWSVVAESSDVKFAFVKITEGSSFVDPCGRSNILNAEAAGVKTGAYHYFSTQSSAQSQFNNFKAHFVDASSLVPMVDVEDVNDISEADLSDRIKEFCQLIEEEYGKKPIIYTRPDLYYSLFIFHNFSFWRKYTFFFWQPIPIHPVFSTGRVRCIWQYSTSREKLEGTSIVDLDVLSGIDLSELLRLYK